jgi:hypothetical protein
MGGEANSSGKFTGNVGFGVDFGIFLGGSEGIWVFRWSFRS